MLYSSARSHNIGVQDLLMHFMIRPRNDALLSWQSIVCIECYTYQ